MNEEEIKKWERHIAKPQEFEFEDDDGNKDKFTLKAISIEDIGNLLYVSSKMIEIQTGNYEHSEDAFKKASDLIMKTLRISYPDIPEETLEGFAKKHFFKLLNAIFQINRFESKIAKVDEKIAQIRRNIEKQKE